MNERNYIILYDEYGQPYIAHTLWQRAKTMASGRVSKGASREMQGVGRGVRTAHKYIEKWGEGAKARYFYTQEELRAALNQGRQKVTQAASSARQAVGNTAARGRAALTTASEKARSAASSVSMKARDLSSRTSSVLQRHGSETLSAIKSGASAVRERAKEKGTDTARKAAEKAKEIADAAVEKAKSTAGSAKDKVTEVVDKAKDKASETIEKVKDKVGIDERERLYDIYDKFKNSDESERDKAYEQVIYAAYDYLNTPLGKIEKGAQTVAKSAAAIATVAGVAVTAVPVVAIGLPLTAAVVVTKLAQIKFNDIKDKVYDKITDNGQRQSARSLFRRK